MKKKLLLIIMMFMFITNVNALTFNVDITNIEDKGNNGTIGSITSIDQENKIINAFFQDIDDEINFEVTITNTGNRAGTLRNVTFENGNNKIEYSSNLPDGGIAINGNDTNKVTITAKVNEGAVNGRTTSNVKINYSYDEGSCPDGEILSDDESMCLCPEEMERNERGICVKPVKPTDCKKDEIYNEQKKICEKKVVPVTPSNPKTLDNIILITLLFIVSGLGIYTVMFKRLKTKDKKIKVGIVTGVITLSLSFVTLASVFGLDNLLSAVINPITRQEELSLTVNEEIELIETWDGNCDLDVADLIPGNIFQDGSGTQNDPYQIKTAEQLSCFAKSVNNGNNYQDKYIKQIKNIKLNNKLLENVENNNLTNLNTWIPIGDGIVESNGNTMMDTITITKSFNGTYDGDNHVISGIYINDPQADCLGLFKVIDEGNIKNLTLSDNYINGHNYIGTLVGYVGSSNSLTTTINNVKTYGIINGNWGVAGIVGKSFSLPTADQTKIIDSENYANVTAHDYSSGIGYMYNNIVNCKNYGNITAVNYPAGVGGPTSYIIDSENHGEIKGEYMVLGIGGPNTTVFGSDNYGNILGRIVDGSSSTQQVYNGINYAGTALDSNNYGDVDSTIGSYLEGVAHSGRVYNSGNTGTITFHDYNGDQNCYVSGFVAAGANTIRDSELASQSFMQIYHDIMGKDFVSKNTENYNSGDVYATNITSNGLSVSMIGNSGSYTLSNVHNTGSMYITNVNVGDNSGGFTMMGTDGGAPENSSSNGDMIIDNFTGEYIYAVGIGMNGANITKSSSEGTIEIKNSTFTGNNSSKTYIIGGTTAGARMTNSFIKGNIKVHDNTFNGEVQIGGTLGSGAGATTSYSEKDIEVYNNTGSSLVLGALGTDGGMGSVNTYNRGNINVHDNSFETLKVSGGTAGATYFNGGNYNSGNIYVKDNYASSITMSGGFISPSYHSNYYNLGNITLETENNNRLTTLEVGGININTNDNNGYFVNAGDITIPYVSTITNLSVGGLFAKHTSPRITNAYYTGTINIGNEYTYSESINYGNIFGTKTSDYNPDGATPSAYYTSEGYAIGLSRLGTSYSQYDANYGIRVNESQVPDILSIINVDNAFEIKSGETLPTLKVFNN